MNDSEPDLEECGSDLCDNLAAEELYNLLVHASGKYKDKISIAPPVSCTCAIKGWCHFSVQCTYSFLASCHIA